MMQKTLKLLRLCLEGMFSMKILINIEPCSIHDLYVPSLYVYKELQSRLSFLSDDNDLRFLISERILFQAEEEHYKLTDNHICIPDIDYRNVFGNKFISHLDISKKLYYGDFSNEDVLRLKEMYRKYFQSWTPDIIISYELYNKAYDYVFPDALKLTYTGGVFKREILPLSIVLDVSGCVGKSFFCKYSEDFKQLNLTQDQNDKINSLKIDFQNIIKENNPIKNILDDYRKKFRYLILLPLQISSHFGFDCECEFKTQWDVVTYVLDNVPDDVGVIVTEHSHSKFLREGKFVKDGFYNWIKKKYSNFIYINPQENMQASSLYILPEVDGVINVSSTVGLLALMFDKKVISLANNYNDAFKDAQGLENIVEVLEQEKNDSKNPFLYWLLTKYNLYTPQLQNAEYMKSFFEKSLEKYKNGRVDFNFYDENMSFDEVAEFILNTIKENYIAAGVTANTSEPAPVENTSPVCEHIINNVSFLQQVFSVKNEYNHKVIRILGLKIKIRKAL